MVTYSTTVGEYIAEHSDMMKKHNVTACRITTACGHCYFEGEPTAVLASMLQYLNLKEAHRNEATPSLLEITV